MFGDKKFPVSSDVEWTQLLTMQIVPHHSLLKQPDLVKNTHDYDQLCTCVRGIISDLLRFYHPTKAANAKRRVLTTLNTWSSAKQTPEITPRLNLEVSESRALNSVFLTRKTAQRVCVCLFLLLNLVIILLGAERKPSVAGESISTRQLSEEL